ncbi:MAG: sulfatase-like hydrolase/transferase [Bacteroidota bacterium]
MKAWLFRLFKYFPVGTVLFPLFICFHGANYVFDWIKLQDVLYFLFNSYLSILILFVLIWFITGPVYNATILSFAFVVSFFCFGYVQDVLAGIIPMLSKPRFTIAIIGIIIFSVHIWVKRTSLRRKIKVNYINNLIITAVTLFDLCIVLFHSSNTKASQVKFYDTRIANIQAPAKEEYTQQKPDVYFIVFDEYASSQALKQNFDFDNDELDTFLRGRGFYIADKAKSNYAVTAFSIASTFNMNYFKDWNALMYPNDFPAVCAAMKNNTLFRFFKKEGYSIYNYSIFNFEEAPSLYVDIERDLGMSAMLSYALTERVDFKLLINKLFKLKPYQQMGIIDVLHNVEEDKKNNTTAPKFFYIHILLPHSPFIFNKDGSLKSVFGMTSKQEMMGTDSYLDQLVYTNKIIKKFILRLQETKKKQIIIVEGDHGFRNAQTYKGKKIPKTYYTQGEYFKNLNAFYFYDQKYEALYDSISPVNTFRVVLNNYFGQQIPLLKDSSFVKKGIFRSVDFD